MEFEKVRDITSNILGIDPDRIRPDTIFIDDLGADSLDLYQIITEIEDEFSVTVPDEEAERIVTVGDAVNALKATKAP